MAANFNGARQLVRAMQGAGVRRLFTLSGNQIMPVFDACLDAGIELIHVRHEAAAVHMADAWGRLTGEPGVALVTAGPGHANALSALYVALAAESPLVLLSGHAPLAQLGLGVFQEMPQAEMAGHVCKASWTAESGAQLGHDFARAMRTAKSGRPGPVHVSLPFDVSLGEVAESEKNVPQDEDFSPAISMLDDSTAREILSHVEAAQRPLVLAGPSLLRGVGPELLADLSRTICRPAIGMESPRGVNDPSLGAFAEVLAEADLIVLIGKALDFTLKLGAAPTINSSCRFIQVDPELRILQQTVDGLDRAERMVLTASADSLPTLRRLIELASEKTWRSSDWTDEVAAAIAYRPDDWSDLQSPADGPLHAVEVCSAIQELLDETPSVLVSDGGEFGQWAQACLSANHRLINGPSGSIGSSLPFGLAARAAQETLGCDADMRVVVLLGDGTFGFHPLEFETAIRHNLPFVAVVGNDAGWNAERQIQLRDYGPDRVFACDLLPTRYDQVVTALGGHGECVTKPAELKPALERALTSNKPACVNVFIQPNAAPLFRRT